MDLVAVHDGVVGGLGGVVGVCGSFHSVETWGSSIRLTDWKAESCLDEIVALC